jgi:hypothetical protein
LGYEGNFFYELRTLPGVEVGEMARRRDLIAAQGLTLEEYAMLRRLEVPKPQTQPLATQ